MRLGFGLAIGILQEQVYSLSLLGFLICRLHPKASRSTQANIES